AARAPETLAEVLQELLAHRGTEDRLRPVVRMIDDEPRRTRAIREGLPRLRGEREPEVLHGGHLLLRAEALLEARGDAQVARDEGDVAVDALEAVHAAAHLVLRQADELGDLDEERRRELVAQREERVVGVELALDPLLLDDALRAHHLLHLEEHGLP